MSLFAALTGDKNKKTLLKRKRNSDKSNQERFFHTPFS
jgi:hypothetical protein